MYCSAFEQVVLPGIRRLIKLMLPLLLLLLLVPEACLLSLPRGPHHQEGFSSTALDVTQLGQRQGGGGVASLLLARGARGWSS